MKDLAYDLDLIALNQSYCALSLERALNALEYGKHHPFGETIRRYLDGTQNSSDSHQLQRVAIEIRKLCIDVNIVREFLQSEADNPRKFYMPSSAYAYISQALHDAGHTLESDVFWDCFTGAHAIPAKRLKAFLDSDATCVESIKKLDSIMARETMPAWGTKGT